MFIQHSNKNRYLDKNRHLDKNQCSDKNALLDKNSSLDCSELCCIASADAFGDTHMNAFGDTHMNAFGVWEGQRLTRVNAFGA